MRPVHATSVAFLREKTNATEVACTERVVQLFRGHCTSVVECPSTTQFVTPPSATESNRISGTSSDTGISRSRKPTAPSSPRLVWIALRKTLCAPLSPRGKRRNRLACCHRFLSSAGMSRPDWYGLVLRGRRLWIACNCGATASRRARPQVRRDYNLIAQPAARASWYV